MESITIPTKQLPLFSILVPVFNAGPYLERVVESALAQTEPRFGLIAVDHGSTDGAVDRLLDIILIGTASHLFRPPSGHRVQLHVVSLHRTNRREAASAAQVLAGAQRRRLAYPGFTVRARLKHLSPLLTDNLWLPRYLRSAA